MKRFDLFDAVRIARLPEELSEVPAYYSQTGKTHIRVGEIGVVIGDWLNDKYRVEAVDFNGAIAWQDHFEPNQLELLPPTAANFSRRRINSHWSYELALGQELLDKTKRDEALSFARKVMAFARRNVDLLIERLEHSGYRFAHGSPWQKPEEELSDCVEELANRGIYIPVAMHAWLIEVGSVDFCGTHPQWPHTAYDGMFDKDSRHNPWYTDPLVIDFSARSFLKQITEETEGEPTQWIEIAPDVVDKANISGGAPVSINCERPAFDSYLVGQSGSFTLLSYLRSVFEWSGFPGFQYIKDAPKEMLQDLHQGLTQF